MADLDDYDFDGTDAGASTTFPMEAGQIKKGGHCVIKNRPCRVVETSTSKTGKHGHAKVHIVALDIFTGKKLEDICPSTHNTLVPHVKREEFSLMDIGDDGYTSLLTEDGDMREDLKVPEDDIGTKMRDGFESGASLSVSVISAMGEEKIIAVKEEST
jgi:translation initiation factor 5A